MIQKHGSIDEAIIFCKLAQLDYRKNMASSMDQYFNDNLTRQSCKKMSIFLQKITQLDYRKNMAPSMKPYFNKNLIRHFVKKMAPAMEPCFYDILPRHFFVKIWLHRWSHVFTKKCLSKFVIKYCSIDEAIFLRYSIQLYL